MSDMICDFPDLRSENCEILLQSWGQQDERESIIGKPSNEVNSWWSTILKLFNEQTQCRVQVWVRLNNILHHPSAEEAFHKYPLHHSTLIIFWLCSPGLEDWLVFRGLGLHGGLDPGPISPNWMLEASLQQFKKRIKIWNVFHAYDVHFHHKRR